MPVRVRITLLFALVVFVILGLVCGAVYYFSYMARLNTIKTRLTNRALTTARLLSQSEIFSEDMIRRIDSSTTLSLKNKSVQAFDHNNRSFYSYSDVPGENMPVTREVLNDARVQGIVYFKNANREAIAYHYANPDSRMVVITAAEDDQGKGNLRSLKDILFFSFLVGVILAIAGGYFFSHGLLMPVRKITREVKEISAQNLARRINEGPNKDEWHQLAVTLNDLLNRLKESFDVQRRFIANASHELSTPLTSVSSQAEVCLQRDRTTEEYKKVLSSILQDVQQMSRLIQTLLQFAKASGDPGGLGINLVRVDEVLLRLPSELQKQDPQYVISLDFLDLPEQEDNLMVLGNEELLFTAIKNIVSNACKYSGDHKAAVTLAVTNSSLTIEVNDRGIGITEKDLENIFQPFYRVEESRSTEGFGLGLSLAHRIIKMHRGNIAVSSTPGQGTSFTISLPSGKESILQIHQSS